MGLLEFGQFGGIRVILVLQGVELLLALSQRLAHVFNVKAQVLEVAALGGQNVNILHRERRGDFSRGGKPFLKIVVHAGVVGFRAADFLVYLGQGVLRLLELGLELLVFRGGISRNKGGKGFIRTAVARGEGQRKGQRRTGTPPKA